MTSQIRSHVESLIHTNNIVVLILYSKLMKIVAVMAIFNTMKWLLIVAYFLGHPVNVCVLANCPFKILRCINHLILLTLLALVWIFTFCFENTYVSFCHVMVCAFSCECQTKCFSLLFQCNCKTSESRSVLCVTKEGTVLSEDKCDPSRRPAVNRSCEAAASTACELANRRWYMSEWSKVDCFCWILTVIL